MSSPVLLQQALVCSICKHSLAFQGEEAICKSCGRTYQREHGIWDLIIGERFPDDEDPTRWMREEIQDRHRAARYFTPLFRSFQTARSGRKLRMLSVGCGVAAEVDALIDEGFECFGIDCGNRSVAWSRRGHLESLVLANGMFLPFPDGYFDVVFAGCVFPHIGTVGDTYNVRDDYWNQRQQLAREMVRVARPDANLVISCPNRLFPLDLFHRFKGYLPRFSLPTNPFLLSLGDFRRLFVSGCGCADVRALPPVDYWGFNQLTKSQAGRLASRAIQGYFQLLSRDNMKALRGSMAAPWLVVQIDR